MTQHKKAAFLKAGSALLILAIGSTFAYQSFIKDRSFDTSKQTKTSTTFAPYAHATATKKTTKLSVGGTVVVDTAGVEVDVDSDRGWFDLQFNDLPALTDAKFTATPITTLQTASLANISSTPVTSSSPLTLTIGNTFVESAPVTRQLRIYARAKTDSALGRAEVLVLAPDGTVVCSQVAAARADAICDTTVSVNLAGTGTSETITYRAYASNSGDVSTTHLSTAVINSTYSLGGGITGPTKAQAFETVKARVTYNHRVLNRKDLQIRFVRVYSSPTNIVREFTIITRWNGKTYAAMPLLSTPGTVPFEMSSTFVDREIVDRAYIDIPVNAQSVTITARRTSFTPAPSSGMPQNVDLYLVGVGSSIGNSIIPFARTQDATLSSTTGDNSSFNSESITLTNPSGRYYVIGKSKFGERMAMRISAKFDSFSAAPDFKFGHYYNPTRPGHGVYIDKVSGQFVLLWYTYLEDGTPTWYIAEGPAPNADQGNSIWEATLQRVVWNGSSQSYYPIGSVRVTLTGESSFLFNYIVDGESGGESFVRLGSPGCINSAGRPFDVSGLWYSPNKAGFGYSAEIISNQEFIPAYLYDQNGMPRWLIGEKAFTDGISSIDLQQLTGFCPLCTHRNPSRQTVGTMARTLTPTASPDNLPGYGSMGVSANFAWPLRGSWNENLPVAMLADRKACR